MPRRCGAVPLTTLADLLRRAAEAAPERVAVTVDGHRALTYGEWEERSSAMAGGLRRAGVRSGHRVVLPTDLAGWSEHAVAYLGVHKAGAVAVPLVAGLGDTELRRVIAGLRPSAIVAAPGLAPKGVAVPILDPLEAEARGDDAPPAHPVRPPEVGEILCVSHPLSRTGYVPRSQRALLEGSSLTFAGAAGRGPLLHAFPMGTLAGQDALCATLHPAPVHSVIVADFDPDRLCGLLAAREIGTCGLHPAMGQALVDTGATARHDLSGVRELVVASGRVLPGLLVHLGAAFPQAALRLVDVLGHPPGPRTVFAHDRSRPGSLGRPVGGTAVVASDEAGRPVGRDRIGRVRAGGGHGATGDLGYVDRSGAVYVVAAGNDVVRCRRGTVVRAEVEGVLREHPCVADAAVLGVPEDDSGGRLVAAVVLSSPASEPELQEVVEGRLGPEKLPDRIFFVDEVPRSGSGAVRRAQLHRHLGLGDQDGEQAEGPAPLQETVAGVWRRVLGREDIGPGDDFFELGGHGSAAATMLGLLEDALEVSLPLTTFLAAPTAGALAGAIERLVSRGGEDPPAAPVAFSQEGMLWHELFAPGSQNLPGLARRYRGPLDVAALGLALDEIVRRHEALRTTFALRGGRPVQVVHAHRRLDLPVRDLTAVGASEREAHVDSLVGEAGRTPFDLVAGPLFETTLVQLADDDHVLIIRTHHSVFDDWSVGVFRRELAALYTAYTQGEDSPLPELPAQFAHLCRRQRREVAGPAGTRELEFWRTELADAPLITQLPVHDPQLPEGASQATGRPVSLAIAPDVGDRLRMLARREGVTVFMILLAAFGVLVRQRTGQDDLLLATVVANRNATEREGPIGCFTKKVPLRLRLHGDPAFSEVLKRARTALLGALSHQDLPFETVIGEVLGAPAAAHGLVPQLAVMFQSVTPAQDLVLPGLETSGFETSTTAPRAHFMARGGDAPEEEAGGEDVHPVPWGAGLYLGTFVILSVADSADGLSCIARGAFHAPAVRELLDGFAVLLAEVADDPDRRLSRPAVDVAASGSTGGQADLRGTGIDLARIESALAGCPGVRDIAVTLERDEHGEPAIVASVVPDRRPPTLTDLRTFLWARLPGYAWPSVLVVAERLPARENHSNPHESLLATLWGEVLGVERAGPAESYSQAFSFTQALARARAAGLPVPGEHVARNRTVGTLATALAAHRHRREA